MIDFFVTHPVVTFHLFFKWINISHIIVSDIGLYWLIAWKTYISQITKLNAAGGCTQICPNPNILLNMLNRLIIKSVQLVYTQTFFFSSSLNFSNKLHYHNSSGYEMQKSPYEKLFWRPPFSSSLDITWHAFSNLKSLFHTIT